MTPKKPDWFEITEGDNSSSGIRKINKKLPLVALIAAGAIIAAGSIFANANNEPSAVAETPTTSQSAAANQQNNSQSAPAPVGTSKSSSGLTSAPAPVATAEAAVSEQLANEMLSAVPAEAVTTGDVSEAK